MVKVVNFSLRFLVLFIIVTVPAFLLVGFGYLNASDGEFIVPITMLCFFLGFRITFYQKTKSKLDWFYRPLVLKDKVKLFLILSSFLLLIELLIAFIRSKYS